MNFRIPKNGCFNDKSLSNFQLNLMRKEPSTFHQEAKAIGNKMTRARRNSKQDDRHNFHPITKILINFCIQLKNEKTDFSSVLKRFQRTSIPPLISTILGIMDLPGLRSKVQTPRNFSGSTSEK